MQTTEKLNQLKQLFKQLDQEEKKRLLEILSSNDGTWQFNSDSAKGFQVKVEGGKVSIGDTYAGKTHIGDTHIYIFDAMSAQSALRDVFDAPTEYFYPNNNYMDSNTVFFDNNEDSYEPNYVVDDYYDSHSNRNYSSILFPVVIIGALAVGIIVFVSGGLGRKTAVIRTPPGMNEVNIRDDSGRIIGTLPGGTNVFLDGKRDSKNYCKTDRGWIYCPYLAESTAPTVQQSFISPQQISLSLKTVTVQPATGEGAANLRTQPNGGDVIGTVPRGKKVKMIRCIDNSCEVYYEVNRGWIYKPYLH
jgi:hypothetical protein